MSDSSLKEKEKQEHTPTDEKNPIYCESHEQICENLRSANTVSYTHLTLPTTPYV